MNTRFTANYTTNTCTDTGFTWVRIYVTRKIRSGEEIYLDYGYEFWLNELKKQSVPTPPPPALASDTPNTNYTKYVHDTYNISNTTIFRVECMGGDSIYAGRLP